MELREERFKFKWEGSLRFGGRPTEKTGFISLGPEHKDAAEFMPVLLGIIFFMLSSISVPAAFGADEITATPNRPGVADPADVTQKGVLEIE